MSQNDDGSFIIGEPVNYQMLRDAAGDRYLPRIIDGSVACYYRQLGGAVWPNASGYAFIGPWKRLPLNQRFHMHIDQFAVKCWAFETFKLGKKIYKKYSGIERSQGTVGISMR